MKYLFFILLLLFVVPSLVMGACSGSTPKECGTKCIPDNNICLNLDYPTLPGGLDLQDNQDITTLIAWIYTFIIAVSGLAAFTMIVWGGLQWMTSSGNASATSDAKDRIKKALLGLLLILSSFIILNLINPELTVLQIPGSSPSGQPPITQTPTPIPTITQTTPAPTTAPTATTAPSQTFTANKIESIALRAAVTSRGETFSMKIPESVYGSNLNTAAKGLGDSNLIGNLTTNFVSGGAGGISTTFRYKIGSDITDVDIRYNFRINVDRLNVEVSSISLDGTPQDQATTNQYSALLSTFLDSLWDDHLDQVTVIVFTLNTSENALFITFTKKNTL